MAFSWDERAFLALERYSHHRFRQVGEALVGIAITQIPVVLAVASDPPRWKENLILAEFVFFCWPIIPLGVAANIVLRFGERMGAKLKQGIASGVIVERGDLNLA